MGVGAMTQSRAQSIVRAARERHGIDVTVLRLLEAARDRAPGGDVTYLAEIAEPVPAEAWAGKVEAHPLRLAYAEPGGPAADLDWAVRVLAGHGLAPTAKPIQIRSWNLSSVWRIPIGGHSAWLKVVPAFLAHEGRTITALKRAIEGGDGGIARVAMCGSGRWLGRSRGAAASVARRFRSKARRMRGERVRK